MFKSIFRTALTETHLYPGREELGVLRAECDGKYGERWFRYVQNRTAGALVADALVQYDGTFIASAVTAVATGSGVSSVARASGSFVDEKVNVDDIIHVLDDAGAAGAAPEGEVSFVTKVEALKLTFSPALTVAIAVGDTVNVIKRFAAMAAAAKAGKRTAGIPVVDLAAGYCGWVQVRGIYLNANIVAAGTAVAEGDRLAAGTAILTPLATVANNASTTDDINDVVVATALQAVSSDTVRRKAVVMLDCQ